MPSLGSGQASGQASGQVCAGSLCWFGCRPGRQTWAVAGLQHVITETAPHEGTSKHGKQQWLIWLSLVICNRLPRLPHHLTNKVGTTNLSICGDPCRPAHTTELMHPSRIRLRATTAALPTLEPTKQDAQKHKFRTSFAFVGERLRPSKFNGAPNTGSSGPVFGGTALTFQRVLGLVVPLTLTHQIVFCCPAAATEN